MPPWNADGTRVSSASVTAAGSVYAAGALRGTGFDFDPGVSQPGDTIDSAGGYDVFVEKLDKSLGGPFG